MTVLVFGGTGLIGSELTKILLKNKIKVRIFTRNAEKAKQKFGDSVEYVQDDLLKPDDIKKALQNISKVFLLTVSDYGLKQPEVEGTIARLAKEAKVQLLIKLSGGGIITEPSNSLIRWHGIAEEQVIASGVPFTIVRPNTFMQGISKNLVNDKLIYPIGESKVAYIDSRDVSEFCAKLLLDDPKEHVGQTYDITGPESLSYKQVAEKLSNAVGRTISYDPVDDYTYFQALKEIGIPHWQVWAILKLCQYYRSNKAAPVTGDYKIVTGKEPRSFEDYLNAYKHLFQKQ